MAELEDMPEIELRELAEIYVKRGLDNEFALKVSEQLTRHDALEAQTSDELCINEITTAKPLQAAISSFGSFQVGALLPFVVSMIAPLSNMIYWQYVLSTLFLVMLGAVSAKAGGSSVWKLR